jgi:hypothetical protein
VINGLKQQFGRQEALLKATRHAVRSVYNLQILGNAEMTIFVTLK